MSRTDGLAEVFRALEDRFGERARRNAPLAPYTSARIGGPADLLVVVRSAEELAEAARLLWEHGAPFRVLGGGSNVLISDRGVRGVVLLNQAKASRFENTAEGPRLWAESGAVLGSVARRAVERGWAGLEWAATVPGTVGGAVVNNAGAHDGDIAGCLEVAEILQRPGRREVWPVDRLAYDYRDSWLKRHPGEAVVLSATFRLAASDPGRTRAKMESFVAYRRQTQPPGASWGSMFKNPHGDFAGRLIEAAGLKGYRVGDVQVSTQHANFFVNLGQATAADAWRLIETVRERVREQFGVALELEIELLGDWEGVPAPAEEGR